MAAPDTHVLVRWRTSDDATQTLAAALDGWLSAMELDLDVAVDVDNEPAVEQAM